jgi:hypothetical protein
MWPVRVPELALNSSSTALTINVWCAKTLFLKNTHPVIAGFTSTLKYFVF